MTEKKTYVAIVAHEHIKPGDIVYTEVTPRMESLLGAGYYREADVGNILRAATAYLEVPDTDPHAEVDWVEADEDVILERFEELDVVEVLDPPVKPRRAAKKA